MKLKETLRKCWEAFLAKRDHAQSAVRIGMLEVSIEEDAKRIALLESEKLKLEETIQTLQSTVRIQDIERTKLGEVCARDLARVISEKEAMPQLIMAQAASIQRPQPRLTIAADDAREPNVA